jgi:hypothetical protein
MDFIYEIENAIPKQVCDLIVKRFKSEPDSIKSLSKIGAAGGVVDTRVRKSTMLHFSTLDNWKDVDDVVYDVFKRGFRKYNEHIHTYANGDDRLTTQIDNKFTNLEDEGYFVQEYKTGDFYDWHVDSMGPSKDHFPRRGRNISCILYLNTLGEDEGGCTEFIGGKKIKPIQGKLLMFPSSWTYFHRGAPVFNGGVKYTIGTWAI